MSLAPSVSLLVAALTATLLVFVVLQGATQQVETQTDNRADSAAEQPSFPTPSDEEFARDQILVELEERATQANPVPRNQRNDAHTEENLPRSDVNVVDLPSDLAVADAVRRYEASSDVEYAEPDFCCSPCRSSRSAIPTAPGSTA